MIPGNKFSEPTEDWGFIAKIKDEQAKKNIENERKAEKQRRLQYKTELDKQLSFKRQNSPDYQSSNDDREFLKAQMVAFKNSEIQQKLEQRNYFKIFQEENSEVLQAKMRQQQIADSQEKHKEKLLNDKILQDLELEKQTELQKKEKKAQEERQELQRQLQEKMLKEQKTSIEKARERELVAKKIEEMKAVEDKYSEFYKKRMQDLDEKMKYFKPSVETFDKKEELIKKRCEDWEVKNNERLAFKERYEMESRNIVKSRVRDELLKQIDYKTKVKKLEYQEGIKYQKLAQQEAFEEEYKAKLKRAQKVIEQDQIRKSYDNQLGSKQSHSLSRLKGESIERYSQRAGNRINESRYRLGIPSILDSPAQILPKQPFQRVFTSNRKDFVVNASFSPDRIPTKTDINQSYEQIYTKRPLFNELSKHNPITNPIGSSIPRILQGQRAGKGFRSQPKLNGIKDIFNHV
ncbi:hypothetical protein SteCoe_3294 [Stentor coeruleus]|uniref:Trichohyalin-plectin-homology domain-containing protein n=1 Tax=Stentor coeruleus TaxID=5963 RepID=A0A1R2CXJ8_9CILI|nr:hypothetical protein SteCoe_3294 [Stentor coeruleus]